MGLIEKNSQVTQQQILTSLAVVMVVCLLPWVLNLFGIDFSSVVTPISKIKVLSGQLTTDDLFYAVAGGVQHGLLEWSAVTIAVLAAIVSFVHYSVHKDTTLPIIGMALLSAGLVDAFHTLAATRIIHSEVISVDFVPFTWAISRIFNAGVMVVAILVVLWIARKRFELKVQVLPNGKRILGVLSGTFVLSAFLLIYLVLTSDELPKTMFDDALVARPFDLLPLAILFMGAALFWNWYLQSRSMVRWLIFLSFIPEITIQLNMAFGSTALFDNYFNIAHFLKIIAYGCIFLGLIYDFRREPRAGSSQTYEQVNAESKPVMLEQMLQIGAARHPLSIKLSIAAFLLSFSVSAIIGYAYYDESSRLVNRNYQHYLLEKNTSVKGVIGAIYQEIRDHLIFVSHLTELEQLTGKPVFNAKDINQPRLQMETLAKNFLATRVIYTGLRYVDFESQHALFSVVKNGNKLLVTDGDALKKQDTTGILNRADDYLDGTIIFSDIASRTSNNHRRGDFLVFEAAMPIQMKGETSPRGLLIIEVNFQRFMQLVDKFALKNTDILLLDHNDQVIYSPVYSLGNKKIIAQIIHQTQRSIENSSWMPVVAQAGRIRDKKEKIISVFQAFSHNQFGQGHLFKWLIQPNSNQLVKDVEQTENRSLLISIGLAFFALTLSLFAARRLILPLTRMISALQHFEEGNEVANLPIEANDETGVLARSFYNMQVLKRFKDKQVEEHQFALDQHAIVSATDVTGTIIFGNPKFSEISGYTEQEFIGKNHRILKSGVHDELFFKQMYHSIANGKVWHGELCNRSKSGALYWLDTTIVPLLDNKGKPYQYISIRTDISKIKAVEKQLISAKNEAEQAVHSKSEFFASMSHEIRTPMNGVLGMLGLMMRTDLNKQQKHYATLARSSADSLLAIIDDILDLSKIEAGKIELEHIDFNIREQLGIFAESMAYRAQDKGLEMILDVTGIDQSMVNGDPSRLRQILSNLVGNSIKFTEVGEISIVASLLPSSDQDWIFRCCVSDTGIGIPADKVDGLFDSYSQVDASTTRKFGGTGLGLAIIKQLCALMQGKVQVTSEFGMGSQFSFDVNFSKSKLSEVVLPQQNIKGVRILVVDDNATNLEVLIGQLKHWGATTISAKSGAQALSILKDEYQNTAQTFDIAILDMGMPEMDGAELGELIRANPNYDSLKLVMMTSMAGSGDISKFRNIGFSAYFPKPATTSDLFLALQVLVDDSQTLEKMEGSVNQHHVAPMSSNSFRDAYVLLVEDNLVNQEVATGILEDMGVKVDIAENGQQAIERLLNHNNCYGLVIMDCQMPVMDGYQASRTIRSGKFNVLNPEIPIIAMTANALKGDREKCLQVGMNAYLTKPVDPNELEEVLRVWLPDDQKVNLSSAEPMDKDKQETSAPIISENKEIKSPESSKNEVTEMNINDDIWDQKKLMDRVRNNKKLAGKLINLLLMDLPDLLDNLQKKISDGNLEESMAIAHRIKGSAANLSANQVSTTAAKIELASRENEVKVLVELMPDFEIQIEALLERLKQAV